MGAQGGARRLDRPARAGPRASAARAAQFDLHDLAIEDAEHPHQRPKLEQYGDALFIVARTAQLIDGRVAFGETHLFVGKGYIVSVRHGASTSYAGGAPALGILPDGARQGRGLHPLRHPRFHRRQLHAGARGDPGRGRGDRGQGAAQADDRRRHRAALHAAPRSPAAAQRRRAAGRRLPAADQRRPAADPAGDAALFRDVTDHIRTVQEKIDNLREVLAFAFEASLLVGQSQETAIAKKLASWAAILAVPTAVAGIYGMNFENMPELKMRFGYETVLAGHRR